ncbi:hypothetical protein AGR7B_pAt0041 [Agrobacterium deltaense RV3]|nr:hypothetical protein AGR7B_pAt0041 [Agrobacterium deltaense RV3]
MFLDGYYRLALRFGADPARAETVMLQSWNGRDGPSVGEMAGYDEQVRKEANGFLRSSRRLRLAERPARLPARTPPRISLKINGPSQFPHKSPKPKRPHQGTCSFSDGLFCSCFSE